MEGKRKITVNEERQEKLGERERERNGGKMLRGKQTKTETERIKGQTDRKKL